MGVGGRNGLALSVQVRHATQQQGTSQASVATGQPHTVAHPRLVSAMQSAHCPDVAAGSFWHSAEPKVPAQQSAKVVHAPGGSVHLHAARVCHMCGEGQRVVRVPPASQGGPVRAGRKHTPTWAQPRRSCTHANFLQNAVSPV